MKTIKEIELFNQDQKQKFDLWFGVSNYSLPGLGDAVFGKNPFPKGWICEITGFCSKYKYKRNFLKGKYDYSRANSKGSRGIFVEYILESKKIYEIKEDTSWSREERYFCKVNKNGDIIKMEEEEVVQCLKTT